jgi:DNA processing protein
MMENLADLEYLMGWQRKDNQPDGIQKSMFVDLNEDESSLVALLRINISLTIDQIALHTNLPMSKVSSLLLNLEFKGLVKCLPGKVFKLV